MTDPEKFSDVQRLLALKKHEQPPPGFYDAMAKSIIAELRVSGQAQEPVPYWTRVLKQAPWIGQVAGAFIRRPVFASICSLGVAGLAAAAFMISDAPADSSVAASWQLPTAQAGSLFGDPAGSALVKSTLSDPNSASAFTLPHGQPGAFGQGSNPGNPFSAHSQVVNWSQ